jgi:hypothetical protein
MFGNLYLFSVTCHIRPATFQKVSLPEISYPQHETHSPVLSFKEEKISKLTESVKSDFLFVLEL